MKEPPYVQLSVIRPELKKEEEFITITQFPQVISFNREDDDGVYVLLSARTALDLKALDTDTPPEDLVGIKRVGTAGRSLQLKREFWTIPSKLIVGVEV